MAKQPDARGMPPALATPTDLSANATRDIAAALDGLLADGWRVPFAHWRVDGNG